MADRVKELQALCDRLTALMPQDRMPDPIRLAEALGVRVRYFDLGEVKGFYVVLRGIPFIALNRALPEEVRTIVCAHELGHHLLHRDLAERSVFNDYELYRMENRTEWEANVFASLLLLPERVLEGLRDPSLSGCSAAELAASLGTTEELLEIRLQLAGIPGHRRISQFPG